MVLCRILDMYTSRWSMTINHQSESMIPTVRQSLQRQFLGFQVFIQHHRLSQQGAAALEDIPPLAPWHPGAIGDPRPPQESLLAWRPAVSPSQFIMNPKPCVRIKSPKSQEGSHLHRGRPQYFFTVLLKTSAKHKLGTLCMIWHIYIYICTYL